MASASVFGALRRRLATSGLLPTRGGGGAPYPGSDYRAVSKTLPVDQDMTWDDGNMNTEPVLDKWATEHISSMGALGYFAAGVGVFYGVYKFCELDEAPSRIPYAPRELPFDGLKKELGHN